MHLPRELARFNRWVMNPLQRHWAGAIPLHGILEHPGRRSQRTYRTPVLVFHRPGGFVILIGYGLRSDWVENLVAAGDGALSHRGVRYVVCNPKVVTGESAWDMLPPLVRFAARVLRLEGVLSLDMG